MGYKLGPTQINGVKSQISRDHRFECQNRELDCVIRNVLFILINFWDLLSEKETNNIYIYILKVVCLLYWYCILICQENYWSILYWKRKAIRQLIISKKIQKFHGRLTDAGIFPTFFCNFDNGWWFLKFIIAISWNF